MVVGDSNIVLYEKVLYSNSEVELAKFSYCYNLRFQTTNFYNILNTVYEAWSNGRAVLLIVERCQSQLLELVAKNFPMKSLYVAVLKYKCKHFLPCSILRNDSFMLRNFEDLHWLLKNFAVCKVILCQLLCLIPRKDSQPGSFLPSK